MILVIDNYDSFTYNLVQYLGELGAEVEVRRNDAIAVDDIAAMAPAAIVLSPGPCTPAQAGVTIPVIRRWGASIPMLRIGRSMAVSSRIFSGCVRTGRR